MYEKKTLQRFFKFFIRNRSAQNKEIKKETPLRFTQPLFCHPNEYFVTIGKVAKYKISIGLMERKSKMSSGNFRR